MAIATSGNGLELIHTKPVPLWVWVLLMGTYPAVACVVGCYGSLCRRVLRSAGEMGVSPHGPVSAGAFRLHVYTTSSEAISSEPHMTGLREGEIFD